MQRPKEVKTEKEAAKKVSHQTFGGGEDRAQKDAKGEETSAASEKPEIAGLPSRDKIIAQSAELNPLHDMASLGRVHDVETLIQAGADREKADAFGRTAVHMAASLGHESVVRMLARLGAKLEQQDAFGQAPLHLAARHGQKAVITALLDLRADANSLAVGGRTCLHLAVDGLQPSACKLLVTMLADSEARDERLDTPLTLAIRCGHTLVLDALIDSKCDLHTRDEDGATPLHLSACKQRLECIEVLVQRNARLETVDKYGLTPLHCAARTGEPEAAEKLVAMKANLMGRTTASRQTPVHLAAIADELEAIDVLIKAKASTDAQDNRGYTALHAAVEYDRTNALSKLLQLGAQRDLQTRAGDTALHLACLRDRPTLVQRLMRQACNVNARGRGGYSALHVACELGAMQCAATLLDTANRSELGGKSVVTNPNAQDQTKQTPLHVAAWHGRVDLCDLLIQNNAEVDIVDAEESTPLSLAVTKDHDLTARCLLRLNADPMRKNAQQLASLQLACVSGSLSVAKTLADMKLMPKMDEPPWRRPMALANFYGHKDVAAYFFKPVPKNRLLLSMVRPVSSSAISATITPIVSEPACTSAVLIGILRPEGYCKKLMFHQKEPPDPFVNVESFAAERPISEEEIAKGKTVQIGGLEPDTPYLLRLIAHNDAGTTHGEIFEVFTRAAKGAGASPRVPVDAAAAATADESPEVAQASDIGDARSPEPFQA